LAALVNKASTDAEVPHSESGERLVREAAKAPYSEPPGNSKPRSGDSLLGSLFSLARTALEASLVSAIRAEGVARADTLSRGANGVPAAECRSDKTVADSMSSAGL
jgi:hypothetical protein